MPVYKSFFSHHVRKLNSALPVIVMVLGVFTSGHVVFIDTLSARLGLQIIMCAMVLLYIMVSAKKSINKDGMIVILLIVVSLCGELAFRYRINKVFGLLVALGLVYVVLVMGREKVIQFIRIVNKINIIFALLALLALFLSFKYSEVFKALLSASPYYNDAFPTGNGLLRLLGHADTWQTVAGIENVPRISAHLKQTSLMPAYFLLPLATLLAYSRVRRSTLIIIMTCVLVTFGGVVYFSLLIAVLLYLFERFLPRPILVAFPFVFLIVFLGVLLYVFIDIYDLENIKDISRLVGSDLNKGDPISNRAASGSSRLSLISFAAIEMLNTFPFPAGEKILQFTIGSNIVTNSLRAGVVGLVLSIIMYYYLFKIISYEMFKCRKGSRLQLFGFSLMYSLVFQAAVYNDFGFSTYYGFVMWACIFVLSNKRRKPLVPFKVSIQQVLSDK